MLSEYSVSLDLLVSFHVWILLQIIYYAAPLDASAFHENEI